MTVTSTPEETGPETTPEPPDSAQQGESDAPLGPAGTKALEAEKAKRRDEAGKRRLAEQELADLRAQIAAKDKTPDQVAIDAATRAATEAATAKANQRILAAEIRAAAAGKMKDPRDALAFMDLSEFEVSPDGSVDTDALADAISRVLKDKPYLGADAKPAPTGSADGGPRNVTGPSQLTKVELKGMSPDAIEQARLEGRLNDLLGIK